MLTFQIDRPRLVADIVILIADCIVLKKALRTRWERPMVEEQRRLARVRRKLTGLFVLLAASRGRLHVRRPPEGVAPDGWEAETHARAVATRLAAAYAPASLEGAAC
jgi:hypothetical protein